MLDRWRKVLTSLWDVGAPEKSFDLSMRCSLWDVGPLMKSVDFSMSCVTAGEKCWPLFEMLDRWRKVLTSLWDVGHLKKVLPSLWDVGPLEKSVDFSMRCWTDGEKCWPFYEMLDTHHNASMFWEEFERGGDWNALLVDNCFKGQSKTFIDWLLKMHFARSFNQTVALGLTGSGNTLRLVYGLDKTHVALKPNQELYNVTYTRNIIKCAFDKLN